MTQRSASLVGLGAALLGVLLMLLAQLSWYAGLFPGAD